MSNQINTNQILLSMSKLSDGFDKLTSQMATGKKIGSAKDDPVGWVRKTKEFAEFNALSSAKESLDSVANSIHIADLSMESIGSVLKEVKNSVETITKSYPPFPPGSERRIEMLKMYTALRKQIEALTYPPDAGAKKILSPDPPDDWTVAVGSDGISRTIRKEEVHPGPTGLNIPDLTVDATDEELINALGAIDYAFNVLDEKQNRLKNDAIAISKTDMYLSDVGGINKKYFEKADEVDLSENAALAKSIDLKNSLAIEALKISGDVDARILQFLG